MFWIYYLYIIGGIGLCLTVLMSWVVVYLQHDLSNKGWIVPKDGVLKDLTREVGSKGIHLVFMLRSLVYTVLFVGGIVCRECHHLWTYRSFDFSKLYQAPRLLSHIYDPVHKHRVLSSKQNHISSVHMIVVCLHGIRSNPRSCVYLIEELKDRIPTAWQNRFLILSPELYKRGNAPLDEVVNRVLDQLQPLLDVHPSSACTLIGVSLGGLVALAVRAKLDERSQSKRLVYVATIASPLSGTIWMDMLSWLQERMKWKTHPWKSIFMGRRDPDLIPELSFQHTRRIALLNKLRESVYMSRTHYVFIATVNDHLIIPFNSGFPTLPKAQYLTFYKSNHLGIQMECARKIISTLFDLWINVGNGSGPNAV